MSLLLVTHDLGLAHITPEGHPETTDRLVSTLRGLRGMKTEVTELVAPTVDRNVLELIHDAGYIDNIHRFCVDGGGKIDDDTYVVTASWDAALHAAGAGIAAVEALRAGFDGTGFVAVRPPGHHAERHQAMGFCLFNNVAIAAAFLREQGERVAIVDWDVHHGNGTQHSFWSDPDLLYVSLHEFPFYPGTGWITESGGGAGAGATVNVPMPAGTSSSDYLVAFSRIVVPVLKQFDPGWILVSAGYDAHKSDPLGDLSLDAGDYHAMGSTLASIVPPHRIVAFLEGGYDLTALETASVATVEGFLSRGTDIRWPHSAVGSAKRLIDLAAEEANKHWNVD